MLAATFLSSGCANSGDSSAKQLAAIQDELGRLRTQNALLVARVEALEMTRSQPISSETPAKTVTKTDDDRPQLDVLRLAPTPDPSTATDKPRPAELENAAGSPEVDPDEPRPVIRSTGRGEVIAQTPRPSKPPAQPRPVKTGSGTPR